MAQMNRRGREVADRCAEIRPPRLSRFHRYGSHRLRSREHVCLRIEIWYFVSNQEANGERIPAREEIRIIRPHDRTSVIDARCSDSGSKTMNVVISVGN